MLNTAFEKETCTRCGGSGRFSYNQMDGDRCFGCSGKGERHTKRGAVAFQAYADSLKAPLGSLKVGDLMRCDGIGKSWFAAVTAVSAPYAYGKSQDHNTGEWRDSIGITVECGERGGLTAPAETLVMRGWTQAEKAEKMAAALAYQATLTKAGKPGKRPKAA